MTKLRLIGAAVLALAIGPATARVYVRNSELPTADYYHGPGRHVMRAQDFLTISTSASLSRPILPDGAGPMAMASIRIDRPQYGTPLLGALLGSTMRV